MILKLFCFVIMAAIYPQGTAKVYPAETVTTEPGGSFVKIIPSEFIYQDLELCSIKLPNGTIFQLYPESNVTDPRIKYHHVQGYEKKCAVSVSDINIYDLGTWELLDIDNLTTTNEPEKKFNSLQLKIKMNGSIKILPAVTVITQRGGNVIQVLPVQDIFHDLELCNIKLPNGTTYQLYPVSNVTDPRISLPEKTSGKRCAVNITDFSVNDVGTWELQEIDNMTSIFDPEKKFNFLPLIIKIEERSETLPNGPMTVLEGQGIHVEILEYMESPKSCSFGIPSDSKSVPKNLVILENDVCGITIANISSSLGGVWSINSTNSKMTIYSFINITVKAPPTVNTERLLSEGTKATLVFGPEESIFCQVTDPKGKTLPSQIGQCVVQVPKVSRYHDGIWTAKVGIQGSTSTIDYNYSMIVAEQSYETEFPNDQTVVTEIHFSDDKHLSMICALIVTTVHSCRMVRSDGRTFIIQEGISNGRYSYFGKSITHDLNNNTIFKCGMQIEDPIDEDLTNWECTIVHGDDNVETGGLLDVVQEVIAIGGNNTVLNITSPHTNIETIKDNSFEILCLAPSRINYCWFKSPNGTQYLSLTPGSNTIEGFEYFGRGLSYGECGIRVKYARKSDTGKWSCNMGGTSQIDFRKTFDVKVHDKSLQAYPKSIYINRGIQIGCKMFDNSSVEYCRFVRPDGRGINPSGNRISAYTGGNTDLKTGKCMLRIVEPSYVDIGSWLCVGKSPEKEDEYYDFIFVHHNGWYSDPYNSSVYIWTIIIVLFLTIATVVILSRYTKVKKVVTAQTVRLRESFKSKKKPTHTQT